MTTVEQKEIRGLNIKTLLTIMGSTVTIVVSFMVGIGKINHRIDQQSYMIEKVVYMNETEVRTIKARLDVIERQLQDFKHSKP